MNAIRSHLARHWHHHLSVWGDLAVLLSFTLGSAASYGVLRFRGGYHPGPLPPHLQIAGQVPAPAWYLGRYVVRIHNQGASNSCVGQTGATITEITARERTRGGSRVGTAFSSGYIWNQLNGGADQGITYESAFHLLQQQGDATLTQFPPDGASDKFAQPSAAVIHAAYAHHVSSYRAIYPWDRLTMEYELQHGRPIAIALPVTETFYNNWSNAQPPVIAVQGAHFYYWHSVTAIGYDAAEGLLILNSWGPQWGHQGRAFLSWNFINAVGAAIVISAPYLPPGGTEGRKGGNSAPTLYQRADGARCTTTSSRCAVTRRRGIARRAAA